MREIKLEILWLKHNRDFTTEIATHYTTVDRLCGGKDEFKYNDVEVIAKRQFTGLKDKNGVEIYEGDIVYVDSKKTIDSIIFSNGCFCLCKACIFYEATYWVDGLEIIGNIHQNAELLSGGAK